MIYQTDATRDKIILQAERCFADAGFFATQMKDIASAVGMSRNTLYRYYQDKTDLALAILERTLARMAEALAQQVTHALSAPGSGHLRLSQLLFSLNDQVNSVDERFVAEFDAYFSGARVPDDFRARLQASISIHNLAPLTELLSQGQADGSIRADFAPDLVMVTLINAIRALLQRLILRGQLLIETDTDALAAIPRLHLTLLLDGLKNQPSTAQTSATSASASPSPNPSPSPVAPIAPIAPIAPNEVTP